jgi:hypothetical protein
MFDATAILIAAIVCIAIAIGITAWLIRRRIYQIQNIHFQRALWRAMKRQHERESQQRAQRRA